MEITVACLLVESFGNSILWNKSGLLDVLIRKQKTHAHQFVLDRPVLEFDLAKLKIV